MREFKFRGLDVMTGSWVFGSHVQTGFGMHYIVPQNLIADAIPQFKVDKTTVGQFTGLKDKNSKEIFGGDIVQGRNRAHDLSLIKQEVTFLNGCFMFGNWNAHEYFNKHQEIEVIGNIYEDQDLLDG